MDTLCPSPPLSSSPDANASAVAPDSQPVASLQHPNPPLPNFSSRHRCGTIARLPKNLRDNINQMLDDGLPYAQVIRKLGPDGKGLETSHIGSWKKGGYQDHL